LISAQHNRANTVGFPFLTLAFSFFFDIYQGYYPPLVAFHSKVHTFPGHVLTNIQVKIIKDTREEKETITNWQQTIHTSKTCADMKVVGHLYSSKS
jgi:hypothetical protein